MTQIPLQTVGTLEGVLRAIKDIKQVLLGRVTFVDNISASIQDVSTSIPADTDIEIDHTLGRPAVGFFAYGIDMAPIIYKSSTPWTASKIFVKSSLSPVTFQLIIF